MVDVLIYFFIFHIQRKRICRIYKVFFLAFFCIKNLRINFIILLFLFQSIYIINIFLFFKENIILMVLYSLCLLQQKNLLNDYVFLAKIACHFSIRSFSKNISLIFNQKLSYFHIIVFTRYMQGCNFFNASCFIYQKTPSTLDRNCFVIL